MQHLTARGTTRRFPSARTWTSLACALSGMVLLADQASAQQALHKLVPQDLAYGDVFGAALSVGGDKVVVGAPFATSIAIGAGAAYVFDLFTGQELFKLVPADGEQGDNFGHAIAVSGSRAVITSLWDNSNISSAGSAYVYDINTGQQLLEFYPNSFAQNFGHSVAVSGTLAVVGNPKEGALGATEAGKVYVFDIVTGQQLHVLQPADVAYKQRFGCSVALVGTTAIIGAEGDAVNGWFSGAAYVFDVTTGQELHKLLPADPLPSAVFGFSVATDGERAVIGARLDDDNGHYSGSVYVFDVSTGQQRLKLLADDGDADDYFGTSVAIEEDRIAVGAQWDDDNGDSGSAYVFDATTGEQLYKLMPAFGTGAFFFGWRTSIVGDRLVVSDPYDSQFVGPGGAVHIFDFTRPGAGFCSGNPGQGTACPCSNDNDDSIPGAGCDNGIFASGAHLTAYGEASVTQDSLVLVALRLEPGDSGLYFQADNDLSPGILWGDGLRCAGGNVKRLQLRFADAGGASQTSIGISAKAGNVSAGVTKFYQCWYRTTASPPCGPGVNDFNSTNGYAVTWLP